MEKLNQEDPGKETILSGVKQSIEARIESLKTEFLAELERTLFDEHLTVEQLEVLVKRAGDIGPYDERPIDFFYISHFEEDPDRSGFPSERGLRGMIDHYNFSDIKLGYIMSDVFTPIHRKGLKSDLRRHNDGLRYDSVGITGSDMKGIFQRVLEQTQKFREQDTEQKYDEGVLRSYIARYAPNNWVPFVSAIRFLDGVPPEKLQLSLREFESGIDTEPFGGYDKSTIIYFLGNKLKLLGPDIEEVPMHVIQNILKDELSKLEEIYAEADAKKGNNYQI